MSLLVEFSVILPNLTTRSKRRSGCIWRESLIIIIDTVLVSIRLKLRSFWVPLGCSCISRLKTSAARRVRRIFGYQPEQAGRAGKRTEWAERVRSDWSQRSISRSLCYRKRQKTDIMAESEISWIENSWDFGLTVRRQFKSGRQKT